MPLDPVIAQGFRGIDLQNPVENYMRLQQMQSAQQQNQLNALKMQEYQREVEQQNRLRDFIPTLTPKNRSELLGYGAPGRQAYESLLKGEKESRESEKAAADVAAIRMKQSRDLLPSVTTPEAYTNWRAYTLQNLPGLANIIPEQYSPETVRGLMLEADKALEQHFVTQKRGGAEQVVGMPKYGQGSARVVPGSYAAEVPLPAEVEAQKVRVAQAGRSAGTTVVLPAQEKAFEAELGKEQAGKLVKDKAAAEDARSIISTIEEGRRLLNSGVITGFGAEFLTGLGAALNQAGVSFAEDSVANTQAFTANMAANVGRIIKQFGAGTGLSNADREYAEKMAGGKVSLDRKSIERILDINERMARNVISLHNRNAAKVKTNIPLTVEEPGRLSPQDQQALDWANSNPTDPRSATIKQRLGAK